MQHLLRRLLLSLALLITAGCGWHPRNTTALSTTAVSTTAIKKIIFYSEDPNGPLSRTFRRQLYLSNVELVEKSSLDQEIPSFRILSSSLNRDTVSVFQDGRTAEYRMLLVVNAAFLIPGEEIHPISVKVYRSFFYNPNIALAKDSEQEMIINEIYNKAVEQLIRQLLNIRISFKKDTSTVESLVLRDTPNVHLYDTG